LQTTLSKTKGQIADAEGKARAAKNDAEKAQKEAKDANDKAETATQLAATKGKEADDAAAKLKESTQLLDTLTSQKKELEDKIAKMGPAGIDPAVVEKLKADLADATTKQQNAEKERDEAKIAVDAQIAKAQANEAQLADLRKEKHNRDLGFMKPGLQGRILAVNPGWNFVVLSVGDKQGVLVNASLVVVRGNEPVARLRVTSVEPSTSIADVLPGSVRKGISVQPGDTVIFEGTRGNQPNTKSPAPETTTPPIAAPNPGLPNS
jgi:hypothetical protein